MRCVLGIDGGGTKCHAMLARDDGQVLGWGKSDEKDGLPQRPVFGGRGRSHSSTLKAVREAIGATHYDELHIASVSRILPLDFLRNLHPTKIQVHSTSESDAAFAQAGETCGIVALAGTGAIVYGLTRDGRVEYMDGLGPLVGDHGGGYEIGLRAIRAAAQSGWHPRHRTSLANDVFAVCGARENDSRGFSLIGYMIEQRDRSEIAGLAKVVNAAANRGDAVACRILQDSAAELASTVHDAVDNLRMADEDYALIGTGGIITHCEIYWTHFCKLIAEFAPRLHPTRPDLPAVVGVTLNALMQLPGIDHPAVKATLFESTRALLTARAGHN